MNRRTLSLFCIVVAFVACTDSTAPDPTQIAGDWVFLQPGSRLEMLLMPTNGTVSGNGSWFAEAFSFGGLTASGRMIGDSVQLALVLSKDPNQGGGVFQTGTFSGRLVSNDSLLGRVTYDGQAPFDARFGKVPGDRAIAIPAATRGRICLRGGHADGVGSDPTTRADWVDRSATSRHTTISR
jgi:hypothetical protein